MKSTITFQILGAQALKSESKSVVGLDEGIIKSVWPKLSDDEKSDWLEGNPDSKAHEFKDKPAPRPKGKQWPGPKTEVKPQKKDEKEPEEDGDDGRKSKSESDPDGNDDVGGEKTWWDKLSADEQDEYLKRHPKSRRLKTNVRGGLIKHAVLVSSNRVRHAVRSIGKSYRRGMRGLRNLKAGKPMSEAEKKGLKKTAAVVATVVVAALVAAAVIATPMGGAALDVATDYMTWLHEHYSQSAEASDSAVGADDTDSKSLKELHDGMVKWLLDQDPKTLADRYGKKS